MIIISNYWLTIICLICYNSYSLSLISLYKYTKFIIFINIIIDLTFIFKHII